MCLCMHGKICSECRNKDLNEKQKSLIVHLIDKHIEQRLIYYRETMGSNTDHPFYSVVQELQYLLGQLRSGRFN